MTLFEDIYNKSHFNEVAVTTFSNLIRKAMADGKDLYNAGKRFGELFVKNPFDNTLQCRTNVEDDANIVRFRW